MLSTLFRLILLGFLLSAVCACSEAPVSNQKPLPRIVVQKACNSEAVIIREYPGRASAILSAEVRPQVGGIIQEKLFIEGSHVKEGDALYKIEPQPYLAAYEKAKGELALAMADLEAAERRVARHATLLKSKAVSQQDADESRAEYARIKARIAAMEAALSQTAIDLERTTIKAPISGFIGRSAITRGSLVAPNQPEALAVIRNLQKSMWTPTSPLQNGLN